MSAPTLTDEHMFWTRTGPEAFETIVAPHRLKFRVFCSQRGWHANSARPDWPPGDIIAFQLCNSRHAAFEWCRAQIPDTRPVMHLITGD